jgi:phosphorylcholine metabolism protein LicD
MSLTLESSAIIITVFPLKYTVRKKKTQQWVISQHLKGTLSKKKKKFVRHRYVLYT